MNKRAGKHPKAVPTLAGLKVEPESGRSAATVYPWDRVARKPTTNIWTVLPASSSIPGEEGGPTCFTIQGERERHIAWQAQQRFLRRAFRNGQLSIRLPCRPAGLAMWFIGLFVVAAAVGVGCFLWTGLHLFELAAESYHVLDFALECGLLACIAVPFVVGMGLVVEAIRHWHLRELQLDNEGIQATSKRGAVTRVSWQHVQDICFTSLTSARLQVSNGDDIWLGEFPDVARTVLWIIRTGLFPERVKSDQRRFRRSLVRAGLYWIAGSILIGFVVSRIENWPGLPSGWMITLLLLVNGLVLAAVPWLIITGNRLERRWRKRLRRSSGAPGRM